ncbi:MAG: PilZ domain-containing protein [Novosphingobium sp.]
MEVSLLEQAADANLGQLRQETHRATVSLACEVRQGSRPWKVVLLEDLSPSGFRISWLPGAREDVPVRIRIPGLQVLSAEVRWRTNEAIGCKFESPLHVAVFDHIRREAAKAR